MIEAIFAKHITSQELKNYKFDVEGYDQSDHGILCVMNKIELWIFPTQMNYRDTAIATTWQIRKMIRSSSSQCRSDFYFSLLLYIYYAF